MDKKWLLKKLLARPKKKSSVLDRLLLVIVLVGTLLITAFIVYFIWFNLTNKSATHLLPAKETVVYLEWEDLNLPPRLDAKTFYDQLPLNELVSQSFGFGFRELPAEVATGRVGYTLVVNEANQLDPMLFFRVASRRKAIEFFESIGLEGEQLEMVENKYQPVYRYPKSHDFMISFVGPYTFLSKNIHSLNAVHDVSQGLNDNLSNHEGFLKSQAHLPRNAWMRSYVDLQNLHFGNNHALNQLLNPLKHLLTQFDGTVRKQPNGFHFNTLTNVNGNVLAVKKGFTDSTPFAYRLADFISANNLAMYIGGANLTAEWQNTLDTIGQLNPAYGIIMEGLVRAQLEKYFGDEVSLRNDIYPLFEGEYAIAIERLTDDQLGLKFILSHKDREFADVKMTKLITGFESLAAQFSPRLKIFTLPDGTESRELVADKIKLDDLSEEYKGYQINCLSVKEENFGFCYSVTNDMVVMTNTVNSLKESIDLTTSPKFTLSQSQRFRQSLNHLSKVSDEITYVDLEHFHPLVKDSKIGGLVEGLLSMFETISWVKHYFNDGVSTEGFLLLR